MKYGKIILVSLFFAAGFLFQSCNSADNSKSEQDLKIKYKSAEEIEADLAKAGENVDKDSLRKELYAEYGFELPEDTDTTAGLADGNIDLGEYFNKTDTAGFDADVLALEQELQKNLNGAKALKSSGKKFNQYTEEEIQEITKAIAFLEDIKENREQFEENKSAPEVAKLLNSLAEDGFRTKKDIEKEIKELTAML